MKIYAMKGLFLNDDNPYAMFTAKNPGIWSRKETFDGIKKGTSLDMKLLSGDENKPLGDFIMMGMSALASKKNVIQRFKRFAPGNAINNILIDSVGGEYEFIAPDNHKPGDTGMAHIFMMFRQYKYLLVTQLVKEEWERLNLTAAVFEEVADMPDECFISTE